MNRSPLKNLLLASLVLISIIFILIIKSNPSLLRPKTPGSFEYVRKGEELLDKARYKDAVSYFEKAYESSPENMTIRSNLIYAYSKYGMSFAATEEWDKAITYLEKAYQTVQNTYTVQNLALFYAKRALSEARKGDLIEAVRDLTNSRIIASDSNAASKNLAISLFNDAVAEYKSGREKTAILFLKEAALTYDDSRIFEFLGDIYYKSSELEKALFYWGKAKAMSPETGTLAGKLEKITKEIELAKTTEAKDFAHFELRYEKDLPIDGGLTNQILEKAYSDVGKDLAYFPKAKTVVFFYSEKNFRDIFKLSNIVRAFYDGNIRMPFPESALDKSEFGRYIYHEYAHAVVSAKTNNNCPIWLNEGIAVWEGFRNEPEPFKNILGKINDISGLSIRSLNDAFLAADRTDANLAIYYLVSYTVVKYITDNWGTDGLRDILGRIAGGQHVMNAIDDEFLLSEKEFEKRWKEYFAKEYLKR